MFLKFKPGVAEEKLQQGFYWLYINLFMKCSYCHGDHRAAWPSMAFAGTDQKQVWDAVRKSSFVGMEKGRAKPCCLVLGSVWMKGSLAAGSLCRAWRCSLLFSCWCILCSISGSCTTAPAATRGSPSLVPCFAPSPARLELQCSVNKLRGSTLLLCETFVHRDAKAQLCQIWKCRKCKCF